MIKEYCFWLTTIKGQGGSEHYCEAPYKKNTGFDCENCNQYLDMLDMQEFTKVMIRAMGRIFGEGLKNE